MDDVLKYINEYGYLAIFIVIFLQEIGIPTIIPNELSLIFFGYLSFTGKLNILFALLIGISADISAALLLNILFYYLSSRLLNEKYRLCAFIGSRLTPLKEKLATSGNKAIFLGRITPFLRSYTSIACGTLKIHPFQYLITAIITACLYTGGFIFFGWLTAYQTKQLFKDIHDFNRIAFTLGCIIILLTIYFLLKRYISISKRRDHSGDKLIT